MARCFNCKKHFFPKHYGIKTWREGEHATLDCPHCGAEHIIDNGKPVSFHAFLNDSDPRWPKDGQGTYLVEL